MVVFPFKRKQSEINRGGTDDTENVGWKSAVHSTACLSPLREEFSTMRLSVRWNARRFSTLQD